MFFSGNEFHFIDRGESKGMAISVGFVCSFSLSVQPSWSKWRGATGKRIVSPKDEQGFPLRSLSGYLPEVAVEEDAEQCQADGKGRPDTGQLHGRIARYEYESQQIGEYRCQQYVAESCCRSQKTNALHSSQSIGIDGLEGVSELVDDNGDQRKGNDVRHLFVGREEEGKAVPCEQKQYDHNAGGQSGHSVGSGGYAADFIGFAVQLEVTDADGGGSTKPVIDEVAERGDDADDLVCCQSLIAESPDKKDGDGERGRFESHLDGNGESDGE